MNRKIEMGALALGMFVGGVAAGSIHLIAMPFGGYAGAVLTGLVIESTEKADEEGE